MPTNVLGTWEGTLYEPASKSGYTIELVVVAGNVGDVIATVNYPEYDCSSTLTLETVRVEVGVAVARERIVTGKGRCIDRGRMMLMNDKGDLKLKWDHDNYDHFVAGYLLRKQ